MKKGIHPTSGPVVFRDRSSGELFVMTSTLAGAPVERPTVEVDGRTYPVIDVDVSSASHPFWTGRAQVLDSEGRVEKFKRRYGSGA